MVKSQSMPPKSSPNNRISAKKFSMKAPQRRASRPYNNLRRPIKQSASSLSSPRSVSSRSSGGSCPTSAMTFHSSKHGQDRRWQRNISKRQLQAALKYGTCFPTRVPGRSKYTWNGITFIIDDNTKQEVTSFVSTLDLPFKMISGQDFERHDTACVHMRANSAQYCHSHSVILVDTSGSMRNSDVHGSRSRLGAVWIAIAEDYIKNRIESGHAGPKDALSVILMGETATFHPVLHYVPTDWVTYNIVLQIYKEGAITPCGHGCYRPALELAESVLTKYDSSPCAMVLAIMSDGRPSDSTVFRQSWTQGTESIAASVASLSSRLGKRLTVSAIGMGAANQFETLRRMAEEAENHESKGVFQVPSMSTSSIAAAISSIATSLTETQLEMNNTQRLIRKMTRENRKQLPILTEIVDTKDFDVYMGTSVEHKVFDPTDSENPFKTVPLQHPDARGVAIAKKAFGEGTERFAWQFFEVAEDGVTVVGEPLVAKESKFVREAAALNPEEAMEKFVRRFCRINHQATKAAQAFNSKLDSIKKLDPDTARIAFLRCSMYCVYDHDGTKRSLGVERRLFGQFQKWNSNNGWRRTRDRSSDLGTIKEEDDSNMEGTTIIPDIQPDPVGSSTNAIDVEMEDFDETLFASHDDVAQAFSHFSYVYGGRKSLICDLQGIYERNNRLLQFTDPVVHFYDVNKESKRGKYGRTDRGEKGIHDFLLSHECNCLCDIVTKGFFMVADQGGR